MRTNAANPDHSKIEAISRLAIPVIDEFVLTHLALFDPLASASPLPQRMRYKAFGELAIYQQVADAVEPGNGLATVADHISDVVNDDRYLGHLEVDSGTLAACLHPVAAAARRGRLNPEIRKRFSSWLPYALRFRREQKPMMWLGLWHACGLLGVRRPPFSAVDILRLSHLGNLRSCCLPTQGDLYDLTHEVFYITDFGCASRIACPRPPVAELLATLILRTLHEGNMDIALELVASACMLSELPPRIASIALNEMHASLRQDNVVGAPSWRSERSTGWPPSVQKWAACYHTMLIAGLTCRLIRRDCERMDTYAFSVSGASDELQLLGRCISEVTADRIERGAASLREFEMCRSMREWEATRRDLKTHILWRTRNPYRRSAINLDVQKLRSSPTQTALETA